MTTTHSHSAIKTENRPYFGAVSIHQENPAAHGGVCYVERCACGAQRKINANGTHEEVGAWDLSDCLPNVMACAAMAADCRQYLTAMSRSEYGRAAIARAGYGAIVDATDHGDDASTCLVARAVAGVVEVDRVRAGFHPAP